MLRKVEGAEEAAFWKQVGGCSGLSSGQPCGALPACLLLSASTHGPRCMRLAISQVRQSQADYKSRLHQNRARGRGRGRGGGKRGREDAGDGNGATKAAKTC